jgi:membrane protease YdiL (CAAX protease family)
MDLRPEIPPPLPPFPSEGQPPAPLPPAQEGPGFIDAAAFFTIAIGLMVAFQFGGAALAMHWHIYGRVALKHLIQQPRFTVPIMAISYGIIGLIAYLLFPRAWDRPFAEGTCWKSSSVRHHVGKLLLTGTTLAAIIQLASSYLPIPKEMPVDAFFRTPLDAWIVVVFGTLVAPVFEELAFRGFLYPALRRWTGSILAAVLTSVPFALLHAPQLAHAASPLFLVFLVSLVLCAVRDLTRSVAASALVHATYNFSLFAVVFFASGGFTHLERLKN